MKFQWPLARWGRRWGVMSATQRRAVLSSTRNGHAGAEAVALGDLRRFVDSLEEWPDTAIVETLHGAFIEASYTVGAPSLVKGDE